MSNIPYNHKAIEKKWRENWEKNPVNVKRRTLMAQPREILLSGYVPISVRKRSARRTLERLRDL